MSQFIFRFIKKSRILYINIWGGLDHTQGIKWDNPGFG